MAQSMGKLLENDNTEMQQDGIQHSFTRVETELKSSPYITALLLFPRNVVKQKWQLLLILI